MAEAEKVGVLEKLLVPNKSEGYLAHEGSGKYAVSLNASDATARDELKPLDACQANLDTLTVQATAEAAKRRAVAGPAIAALRADERYAPARDRCSTASGP